MEDRHILNFNANCKGKREKVQDMLLPGVIVLLAALFRLVPHLPNVTPIASLALFGGAYLSKRYALILPLCAMLVSDIFLGFHPLMPFVYGSFMVTGLIGMWLRAHRKPGFVIGASLAASVIFFIVTNFGAWTVGGFYPKTMQGLLAAYVMGLPFFRNTLLGDLIYTALFFGGFEAVKVFLLQRNSALTT